MTLRKLFEMCTNCGARKFFKIMINGNVEVLPIPDGLENTENTKFIVSLFVVES